MSSAESHSLFAGSGLRGGLPGLVLIQIFQLLG